MNIAAYIFATLSLLMSALLFLRIQAPNGFFVWFPKLLAGALSPIWAVLGIFGVVFGVFGNAPVAAAEGAAAAVCMLWYIWKVTHPQIDITAAFASQSGQQIAASPRPGMLKRRWAGLLLEPDLSKTCMKADVPFWTIPGSDRKLHCDIWQPAPGVKPTGIAILFFHGSAWYLFDKDFGTRPFFSHLAAQGHVIMDVSYRLCPEVDAFDMVGDVKRAVAWMKANAEQYGVNPQRIILAGASAGGHLSMLSAYAPRHPLLTPEDVKDADLSVRGVISLYGPCDLRAIYFHTNQQKLVGLPKVVTGTGAALDKKNFKDAGRIDILVGGHPNEVPEKYDLASPITHAGYDSPPTLLIQGQHDIITPVTAARSLYASLANCGAPAVSMEFPCTDHGYDLMLPVISPTYQSALYTIDRFLAVLE